ncbi:MAG TPA: DUF4870 domain-containing protein [Roseiflexaceae bacterium]|nr:DUF4870 domain-containing protein [Roseiflexaceae bacterium]
MQPSEDERVLAALSHASIVANAVNLLGMLATALIWAKQRDRSTYVRSHALQALIYQGSVLLISIFMALFGGLCLALSLLPVLLRPDLYRSSPPSYSVWVGVLTLLALIGFSVLATLYGLYGAYQAYRGRAFRYLLIGRLTRQHVAPAAPPITPVTMPSEAEPVAPSAAAEAPEPPDTPVTPAPSQETPVAPPAPKRRGRRPPSEGEP